MSKATAANETPLMKQYNSIKAKHPDAILLFRVGDFYETFGEDAVKASKVLGIVLTKRGNGSATEVALAGFPHHSLETYLPKLVRAGYRVAVCDQLEDPKFTKTIVKRGITEMVTPGVTFNDHILDAKSNNFLAAICWDKSNFGLAFMDVSTGEFLTGSGDKEYADKLLQSFKPGEILFPKNNKSFFRDNFGGQSSEFGLEDWVFTSEFTEELLLKHFGTKSLKGFGIEKMGLHTIAAGAALHYLSETRHDRLNHITKLQLIEEEHYVWLDKFTARNLEIFYTNSPGGTSLVDVLDQTSTPMGGRLLKRWIALPLKNKKAIEDRLEAVEELKNNTELRQSLQSYLSQIGDLERLMSKIAAARINPREMVMLRKTLDLTGPIKELCLGSSCLPIKRIGEQLNPCETMRDKIANELQDEPPALVNKGNVIKQGVNPELDELRKISTSGKEYLLEVQQREALRTGITSLKVAYNQVFGYYIEVTNAHKNRVPDDWVRKQTLTNAERYITEELKEYETKILGAEEKILALETRLFEELVLSLTEYTEAVQLNSGLLAKLDCLCNFAFIAIENNYTKPILNDGLALKIVEGRHPVIEKLIPVGEQYVPNSIQLDPEDCQIIILTGPNMSGKSALLRQTALIVVMAQIGSFVPATKTELGVVDKIFTRVGASDNLSSGESTFMVEMNETASILNNLTPKSLVILDEIGRGTSTYDGISIAWSITEFLHENGIARPKTMFATHYHELNELEKSLARVKNYSIAIKEINKKIIFLRKLVEGGSEHSFGIHVAQMAGMPKKVIERANQILSHLEKDHSS
ncbi:MAG: DNA mismatch repair protein MutS, partial [Bacteroidia bacterium]|nr:DNA mismatch repair protein MutS [Bacteroidia bacterium]